MLVLFLLKPVCVTVKSHHVAGADLEVLLCKLCVSLDGFTLRSLCLKRTYDNYYCQDD